MKGPKRRRPKRRADILSVLVLIRTGGEELIVYPDYEHPDTDNSFKLPEWNLQVSDLWRNIPINKVWQSYLQKK